MLQSQGRLKGSGIFKLDPCEVCIMGKNSKLLFKSSSYRAKNYLEYVYCDIWGPARQNTLGGARFLSIMDDHSRKLWVFLLKSKAEVFEKFKAWSLEVENEKNCTIKCLKTHNGMEFLSHEFQLFCQLKGIQRQTTLPGNPQQNGIIESMNRTLLDKGKVYAIEFRFTKNFLG